MRSGKSFAAHLTGMCAAQEAEDTYETNRLVQRWLSGNPLIQKPVTLPTTRGALTIVDVNSATTAEEHIDHVREWAQSVGKRGLPTMALRDN